jgi:hypothetical protein
MTNTLSDVPSPCVQNCCLDDNDMCLGCFRMIDEILIWGTATTQQRLDVVQACALRKQDKIQRGLL